MTPMRQTPLGHKPEVLAPAGTMEAVEAVLEAGADAVYVGGKLLNMRMHRATYNFDDVRLAEAIELAQGMGRKLLVTVNSLVHEPELAEMRTFLESLGRLGPDALIVQDLAVAAAARETCVQIPLHASTMMNVHSVETATALGLMGFKRAVASRDIPLSEVRRIGEATGMEMECFIHGDMCVSQSSQCYASAIAFGESSNRGRCMKSCRWKWQLLDPDGTLTAGREGEQYLLARKDLCMLQHVPELVANRVASLKIEGRMRTPEFLVPIVAAYRRAVDEYFENPTGWSVADESMEDMQQRRVRELSTCLSLHNPGTESVDPTGTREPRQFSVPRREAPLTIPEGGAPTPAAREAAPMELAVRTASPAAAEAALDAGANAIYVGGDCFVAGPSEPLDVDWLAGFAKTVAGRGARLAVLGTRIADRRDLAEWRWLLDRVMRIPGAGLGVSTLGQLEIAREMRFRELLADFSMNITNSAAADELSTCGATRVTAAVELSYAELAPFAAACRLPLEVIGQGPLPAMVMEHCPVAAAAGRTPQDVCDLACHRDGWVLRDAAGQDHLLRADNRCRNHLYMANDVCVLPNLSLLAAAGVAAVRIEAQFESADAVGVVVGAYRRALDMLSGSEPVDILRELAGIEAAIGRPIGDGALDFGRAPVPARER